VGLVVTVMSADTEEEGPTPLVVHRCAKKAREQASVNFWSQPRIRKRRRCSG